MRTNIGNYYDLMSFGLGGTSFQEFVNRFNEIYNVLNVDGFEWDPNIQMDSTYEQMISALNIATLPIYTDEDSEALDKSLGEFKIGRNSIPTQKHRYPISAKTLREKMILFQKFGEATLTSDMQNVLMNLLYDSTDKLIMGNRNALTHQRMRIASTGQFTIDAANNQRGITGITFDFGVPDENKESLTTTSRWWTNATHITANEGSAAYPLKFLKEKAKELRKKGFPKGHFEMSENLYNDLLSHSAVVKAIGYSFTPSATADGALAYGMNLPDDAKKQAIERIIGCPIKVYDSVAAVEKFDATSKSLKVSTIENFENKNVSFIPDGNIGTIKSVQPMVFTNDPTQRTAWFDGGRTLITNKFNSNTKTMYVESEMATLCVPSMPNFMAIYTVTA